MNQLKISNLLTFIILWNFLLHSTVSQDNDSKPGKYSAEELDKLRQIRESLENSLEKESMKSEKYLMRWLRAKNMNVDATKDALKKAMEWRKENKVQDAMDEPLNPEIARNLFYTMDTFDKKGRPVLILQMKKLDQRKFAVSGQSKQYLRAWIQMYEKFEDKIAKSKEGVSQGVTILDLEGYSLRVHGCIPCIPMHLDVVRTYDRYYPGLFEKIIDVNAPRGLSPLLELAKPLMSASTRDTLFVYGPDKGEWRPKLLELISASQLPSFLGGTKGK